MKVQPLGDGAYVLRDLDRPAYAVAAALNRAGLAGLREAVASYETVGLYVDPELFSPELVENVDLSQADSKPGKAVRIPVCYELGEDTEGAARRLHISVAALRERHAERPYRCFAVGFCPGFAYLGYLEDSLAGLPRRSSPRVRVEPGSVAITGRQTTVYPLLRPGGWWLIGRTPLVLVDVEDEYFPIEAGDEVTFYPIGEAEYERRKGERL